MGACLFLFPAALFSGHRRLGGKAHSEVLRRCALRQQLRHDHQPLVAGILHVDLTPVQKSLTEMQRSLTEMNKLLERVGNLSEKYSCKWIRWLPDFSLLVALKWIALLLVIGAAAMAGWYGVVAIRSLFP